MNSKAEFTFLMIQKECLFFVSLVTVLSVVVVLCAEFHVLVFMSFAPKSLLHLL
jgi:hypothetical protein